MSNSTLAQKLKNKLPQKKSSSSQAPKADVKQVRLRLVYIDFMSAVKLSFLLGVAQFIVVVVGSFLLYLVFVQTGIFDTANSVAGDVLGGDAVNVNDIVSVGRVLGAAAAIGFLNMIVITVLGAIMAILYNAAAKIVGGFTLGFTNQQ
jgi:hypothetical protein